MTPAFNQHGFQTDINKRNPASATKPEAGFLYILASLPDVVSTAKFTGVGTLTGRTLSGTAYTIPTADFQSAVTAGGEQYIVNFKVTESPTGGNAVRSVDVVRVPRAEVNAQYDRNVTANGNGGPTGTSPSLESGRGEGYNGSGERFVDDWNGAESESETAAEGAGDLHAILRIINYETINSNELIRIIKKSPPIGKEIISKISMKLGTSIKENPLRQAYENEVENLSELVKELKALNKSDEANEAIARQLNQARRDLGIKYKDLTPQLLKEYIYDVNLERYQDPLGPTVEFLLNQGKTWSEITESACRPNPDVDILLGGFEKWMIEKCGL